MYRFSEKVLSMAPYTPVKDRCPIHLDANESFLSLPEAILEEGARLLHETAFNRYPDPTAEELCRAFGELYQVPWENVTAGNGSDELITVIFSAFLEKGEAFATLEPDFSMYGVNGSLHEARHVAIEKDGDYRIQVDRVLEVCQREKVRLLIFSNPCNPTSLVLPKAEVRRLLRGTDALVVLDEAYMDFSGESLLAEYADYDNLILLRTCSKAIGMAGLRLGFALAGNRLTQILRGAKSPYNVNVLSQKLGTAVLRRKDLLEQAVKALLSSQRELTEGLKELEQRYLGRFTLLPGETNFAALILPDPEKLVQFLWGKGIAVRLTGGILRITCGTVEENQALLQALNAYWKE